jgi:hypothetical protein
MGITRADRLTGELVNWLTGWLTSGRQALRQDGNVARFSASLGRGTDDAEKQRSTGVCGAKAGLPFLPGRMGVVWPAIQSRYASGQNGKPRQEHVTTMTSRERFLAAITGGVPPLLLGQSHTRTGVEPVRETPVPHFQRADRGGTKRNETERMGTPGNGWAPFGTVRHGRAPFGTAGNGSERFITRFKFTLTPVRHHT